MSGEPIIDGGVRILVVDDHEDGRLLYAEFFSQEGFIVDEARGGQEAIAKAVSFRPSVVLLDMSMPDVDGWAVMREIRSNVDTKDIYVIALTGHAEARYRDKAREVGVNLFLVKPATPSVVLAHVREGLAKMAAAQAT